MHKDSWLYSDSFMKRAFAIWGHHFVANIIISACFFVALISFMVVVNFYLPDSTTDDNDGMQNIDWDNMDLSEEDRAMLESVLKGNASLEAE